jgi:hypothetical protein
MLVFSFDLISAVKILDNLQKFLREHIQRFLSHIPRYDFVKSLGDASSDTG